MMKDLSKENSMVRENIKLTLQEGDVKWEPITLLIIVKFECFSEETRKLAAGVTGLLVIV